MNYLHHNLPDEARSKLRSVVANMDEKMASLSPLALMDENRMAIQGLNKAWKALVTALALGPEPRYRQCPTCKNIAMYDATVCGYCWKPLARHSG